MDGTLPETINPSVSRWTTIFVSLGVSNALLLESGDYLLLEGGSKLELES